MTARIAEITERLGKATPGEWDYYGGSHTFGVRAGARYIVGCDINCYVNGNVFPRNAGVFLMVDAQFIAHAKGDIEYLLSALSAMSARVEEARRDGLEQAAVHLEALGAPFASNLIGGPYRECARELRSLKDAAS